MADPYDGFTHSIDHRGYDMSILAARFVLLGTTVAVAVASAVAQGALIPEATVVAMAGLPAAAPAAEALITPAEYRAAWRIESGEAAWGRPVALPGCARRSEDQRQRCGSET